MADSFIELALPLQREWGEKKRETKRELERVWKKKDRVKERERERMTLGQSQKHPLSSLAESTLNLCSVPRHEHTLTPYTNHNTNTNTAAAIPGRINPGWTLTQTGSADKCFCKVSGQGEGNRYTGLCLLFSCFLHFLFHHHPPKYRLYPGGTPCSNCLQANITYCIETYWPYSLDRVERGVFT